MHLRYEEDFVEDAVQVCASGRCKQISSLQLVRFNREREKLYSILDPDERNTAFFALHLEWFREWGMEISLSDVVRGFPLMGRKLEVLAFRKPRGKHDEGAELYVNEAQERNAVVSMRPERFRVEQELRAFLCHELMHLNDMLDPAFAYEPELPSMGVFINQYRLARERYRLLWDISIDGRLTRRGLDIFATKEQRWLEFTAAFGLWAEPRQHEVFRSLWGNPAPRHSELVTLLQDARALSLATGPQPGAPCPLCGFPTHAWAPPERLDAGTIGAIGAEFAHWNPEQGVCSRCVAIYRANRA